MPIARTSTIPPASAAPISRYCGRDIVDDLARYGRIDVPRLDTEFCRRHRHLFDLLFRLIYEDDPRFAIR